MMGLGIVFLSRILRGIPVRRDDGLFFTFFGNVSTMKYQEGIKELKHGKGTKFILTGSEDYLKEQFVKAARILNPEAEFVSFGPDMQDEALSYIYSDNLFGRRIIVLHDFSKMKVDRFNDIVNSGDDIIIMILPGKGEASGKAVTKMVSLVKKIECIKMREYGNDFPLWISSKVRAAGHSLEDGCDDMIYARVGPNMFKIDSEIQKLILYKDGHDDKVITKSDVAHVVSLSAHSTSFELLENLINRNISGAIRSLESWMSAHDGFSELIGFLSHYIEKMYRMVLLRKKGMSPDDIASVIGLPRFIIKTKYLPKAQSLGPRFIANILNNVRDLDLNIRTFKGDKRILLENFVYQFSV